MVTIDSDMNITMPRGNTLITTVGMIDEETGETVSPETGSRVVFSIKPNELNRTKTRFTEEDPLFTVEVPIDTMILKVEADATEELDFGEYAYDIRYIDASGNVDIFINHRTLTLTPEAMHP